MRTQQAAVTGPVPLSVSQEQLWLAEQVSPDSGAYHELWAVRLAGPPRLGALRAALATVVRRHDALRTTVHARDGVPCAVVRAEPDVPLELIGDRGRSAGEDEALRLAREFAERGYDLARGPLLRCGLIRLTDQRHLLLVGAHHIVMDGWSMIRLLTELARHYANPSGPPGNRPAPYQDFAGGQREAADSGASLSYWRTALAGAPTVLNLPTDRPRPPRRRGLGARTAFPLPEAGSPAVRRLAEQVGGSRLSVLLTAFGILLGGQAGADDLVVGTGVPGRLDPTYDDTIGMFANMLPVRLRIATGLSAREVLTEGGDALFDAFDHQELPFESIVRAVEPSRDAAITPLVQAVFTNWAPAGVPDRFGDLAATVLEVPRGRSRFDLLFELVDTPDGPVLQVEYDTDLFGPSTIATLVTRYRGIVGAITADPDTPVAALCGPVVPVRGSVIHGFRVREEDVEALLCLYPGVRRAIVTVLGVGADAELHAEVEVSGGSAAGPAMLLAHLAEHLPRSVLPARITVHGADPADEPASPDTPALRAALTETWRAVLDVTDDLDEQADFFALGGHSLLATRLAHELSATLTVPVGALDVFEQPTIAELAALLATRHPDLEPALAALAAMTPDQVAAAVDPPADPVAVPATDGALSTAERQLWLNEQLMPEAGKDFLSPLRYRIDGPLDIPALGAAVLLVARRHDVLRGGYPLGPDGIPRRVVGSALPELSVVDIGDLPADARAERAARLANDLATTPFELDRPPLVRLLLLRLTDTVHVLVLVLHHLITDAMSMRVLTRELGHLYAGGAPEALPAPPSYADYVGWEQRWLASPAAAQAVDFWTGRLRGAPRLELPADSPAAAGFDTEIATLHLDPARARAIAEFTADHRVTPFMLVTAAYCAMLGDWAGQSDVLIGTLVDNRPGADFDDAVGTFANVVALRVSLAGDPTFVDLLTRTRNAVVTAYAQQTLPFARVAAAVSGSRARDRMPVFGVTSAWVDRTQIDLPLTGCRTEHEFVPLRTNRFELSLFAGQAGDELVIDLEYHRERWHADTIAARLRHLDQLLRAAVAQPTQRLSRLLDPAGRQTS